MARRSVEIDSERWHVYLSGRDTVYQRDEFGLLFEKGTGPERVRRVTRFSPQGPLTWDAALARLSDRELVELFRQSQIAQTSPETQYGRRRA